MPKEIRISIPTPSHIITTDGTTPEAQVGYSSLAEMEVALGLNRVTENSEALSRLNEIYELGNISGTVALDLDYGSVQTATLTGNTILSLPLLTTSETVALTLILTNDGSHSIDIVASQGFFWVGTEAPELNQDDQARNILLFRGAYSEGWIGDGSPIAIDNQGTPPEPPPPT